MVLDVILYAYAFMDSGLFIPTLGAYFWRKGSSIGALAGMLLGGGLTLLLLTEVISLPTTVKSWGFDASIYGIILSAIVFLVMSILYPDVESTVVDKSPEASIGFWEK